MSTGLLAAGLAVVAAAVATARPAASEKSRDRAAAVEALPPRAKVAGASLLWVACALVPLVPVARIGSAYFYAFAVTGAALALAAGFAAWPRTAVVATVAALALLSQHARRVDVFSAQPDAWAPVSHVNRYYVERAAATTRQLLAGFRTAASPVAPGTLFLFGGLPPFSGFQAGDGAIVRWEMRDTTLRAVYLTDFRRTLVRPGQPVRSLNWRSTFFREVPQRALYLTLGSVLTELGEPVAAKDAFGLSVERDTVVARPYSQEFLGFLAWADGDTAEARRQMTAAGKGTAAIAPPARLDAVRVALARKDSTQAVQAAIAAANDAPFDPGPHRQLVDLALSRPGFVDFAAAQGFALCTIAPRDTATWRRWARVLAARGRVPQGLDAIARFRALAPDSGRGDAEIDSIEARLTRAAASS